MYCFRVSSRNGGVLHPADVRGAAFQAGVRDGRFSVSEDQGTTKVQTEHKGLAECLHQKLGRVFFADPVEQQGFERQRVRAG